MKALKQNLQNNSKNKFMLIRSEMYICQSLNREVAEWFKAHAWKAC